MPQGPRSTVERCINLCKDFQRATTGNTLPDQDFTRHCGQIKRYGSPKDRDGLAPSHAKCQARSLACYGFSRGPWDVISY